MEHKDEDMQEEALEEERSSLEEALDECLKAAIEINLTAKELNAVVVGRYPNCQPTGPSGWGKTAIIKSWAKENDIHLYGIDLSCLSAEDLKAIMSAENTFELLNQPRTVLFIEHYEKNTDETERLLGKLIDKHVYTFNGKKEFLPELLFTIAEVTIG